MRSQRMRFALRTCTERIHTERPLWPVHSAICSDAPTALCTQNQTRQEESALNSRTWWQQRSRGLLFLSSSTFFSLTSDEQFSCFSAVLERWPKFRAFFCYQKKSLFFLIIQRSFVFKSPRNSKGFTVVNFIHENQKLQAFRKI